MNLIQKIISYPFIQSFVPRDYLSYVGVILVFLLVFLLFYLMFTKWKKKKKTPEEQPEKIETLHPKALVGIWKQFLKNIPSQFKRSIMMYHPFVVMGEAGSGKTSLIDTYSDWKNQANQFYPSYTRDALVQIYLGSRVIVQEITPSLLHDTSIHARTALVKLWKKFRRKKNFTVIITLKVEDLLNGDPDVLKEQAQIIRGKTNVISRILKKPADERIAITFMNQIKGFNQFSDFITRNAIPFHIDFNSHNDIANLDSYILPCEKYLPNMLISETSENYLKILSFFRILPEILKNTKRFINVLTAPDPLCVAPNITRILFTADRVNTDTPISNPFETDLSLKEIRRARPLLKHQLAAAALLIAGVSYLIFSYQYKKDIIMENYALEQGQVSDDILLQKLEDASAKIADDPVLPFLVDFFPDADDKLNAHIYQTRISIKEKRLFTIRNDILLPGYVQLIEEKNTFQKSVLMLALIYASNANELGLLIKNNMDTWHSMLNLSSDIILEYISLSDTPWKQDNFFKALWPEKQSAVEVSHTKWLVFLNAIEKFNTKSYVTAKTLLSLKQDAHDIMFGWNDFLEIDFMKKIIELLDTKTVLAGKLPSAWKYDRALKKDFRVFKNFLVFFQTLTMDNPKIEGMNLELLFENLRVMMARHPLEKIDYQFAIDGMDFKFNTHDLHGLMVQSSIVDLLRNYISYYDRYGGHSFFSERAGYENYLIDIPSDKYFFFSSRDKLDGRYTKKAYDENVKPVIDAFPELLNSLPIDSEEKNHFSTFIFREIDAYSRNYVDEFSKFYRDFRISAESVGKLTYVLSQIQLPISQFQEFLMLLEENLNLEMGENQYYEPLKSNFHSLGFVELIMANPKDQLPELDNYRKIVGQMLDDIQNDSSVPVYDKADELSVLKSMLPPTGRICLTMLREDKESYLRRITEWGQSVDITEEWLYPFTEVAYQAYLLGLPELERVITEVWEKLRVTLIVPLMNQYPFNPEAEAVVTPDKLKVFLYPYEQFWKTFNEVIAPVCVKKNGKWQERTFVMGTPRKPDNMLKVVNYFSTLTQTLLDNNGEPRPLMFQIKSHPLPLWEQKLPGVILSYIQCGENSVFGFNQQPAWQDFTYKWWEKNTAAVGVEFSIKNKKSTKRFINIEIPSSFWSFYRLLDEATPPESEIWRWHFKTPEEIEWKREITFSIQKNPWDIFMNHPFGKNSLK